MENGSVWTYKEYLDWPNGISDKNIEREFHKGMLEADKELQRVCGIYNKFKYIAKYDNAKKAIIYTEIPKTPTRDTNYNPR